MGKYTDAKKLELAAKIVGTKFEGTKATIKGWSGLWPIEKALTEPFKPYARC